ncbi:MAG TPA: glycosyltransferase family 4 protein [Gammaproteobacteria bacterium]|nr:glycosyltransferase family 4 protein [Gammaproteobacteria bacterium]
MKPVVLTFLAYYLPGFRSGGPVRTISNVVDQLGDEFDFRIITRDRDVLDDAPYPGVNVDDWNSVGKASVFYASPGMLGLRRVARFIRNTPHDVVYLNSFFDPRFTVFPLMARRLGMISRAVPFVIAPRGEFSEGALALKARKKKLYLSVAHALGMYDRLRWQASSMHEAEDIRRVMGAKAREVVVAPDLPAVQVKRSECTGHLTRKAALKVIFLSRVTPKKNLEFALRTLGHVKANVEFNIFGPIEDAAYWGACQRLIRALPKNVSVGYQGSVEPAKVPEAFAGHDLFFLPTLGENYGHVIPEALSAGLPVLISDTTPWRDLEREKLGWSLPLGHGEAEFAKHIDKLAAMPLETRRSWSVAIRQKIGEKLSSHELIEANRELFQAALR